MGSWVDTAPRPHPPLRRQRRPAPVPRHFCVPLPRLPDETDPVVSRHQHVPADNGAAPHAVVKHLDVLEGGARLPPRGRIRPLATRSTTVASSSTETLREPRISHSLR